MCVGLVLRRLPEITFLCSTVNVHNVLDYRNNPLAHCPACLPAYYSNVIIRRVCHFFLCAIIIFVEVLIVACRLYARLHRVFKEGYFVRIFKEDHHNNIYKILTITILLLLIIVIKLEKIRRTNRA